MFKLSYPHWFISLALILTFSTQSHAQTIKIAALSPDGSSWMKALRQAGKDIKKSTNGRVKLKFYPGGVMGDDKAVLRKIRYGQLQGAALTNGSLANHFADVQLYNLVMTFRNLDEVDFVRKHFDQEIIEGLEKNGLVTFGLSEIGFAYLMSKHPIHDVNDVRQRKPWSPAGNEVAASAIEAFDITPIPLPIRDVMIALQTGMVDTIASSSTAAIALQWHTQVKYIVDFPLSYIYGALVIDSKAFKKMQKQDQLIVRRILGDVSKKLDSLNRKDNISAFEALQNQGIEVIQPSETAIAELTHLIQPSNAQLIKNGRISPERVAKLQTLLDQYRASKN